MGEMRVKEATRGWSWTPPVTATGRASQAARHRGLPRATASGEDVLESGPSFMLVRCPTLLKRGRTWKPLSLIHTYKWHGDMRGMSPGGAPGGDFPGCP